MKVAVTGGAGLVGGNVARCLLMRHPDARVVVVERDDEPGLLADHLAPYGERVERRVADVRDPAALAALGAAGDITHVVHAAAMAHVPEWERRDPRAYVEVNVAGVLNVLDWARSLPRLERVIHVSSGGVYGEPTEHHTDGPQPEQGPFNPPEVYAITKLAGEQLARRYGALYDIDVRVIRLSAVFGPLERPTCGRALMSLPYFAARALAADRPLRLSRRTLGAAGDWLSGVDVAHAVDGLLVADALPSVEFNVAFGRLTGVEELLDAATVACPAFRWTTSDPETAEVDMDPARRRARWNAYSTDRLRQATTWSPRPLTQQFDEYFAWALEHPATRCP